MDGGRNCRIEIVLSGGFHYRAVPPGAYRLDVVSSGLRPTPSLELEVEAGGSAVFEIPVYALDRLDECTRLPRCVQVVTRWTSEETEASVQRRLELLGWRLALAMAIEVTPDDTDWVACVRGEPGVVALLGELWREVVPADACEAEQPDDARLFATGPYRHLASGRPARVIILTSAAARDDGTALVRTSFFSHGNGGGGYECSVEPRGDVWVPTFCRRTVDY
jgi:hypothetical protein